MCPEDSSFFDETGYESEGEEELDVRTMHRKARESQMETSKALTPTENNMTLSMRQGEELIQMMKNRGFEMNDVEVKKMKVKAEAEAVKASITKSKAGFFDGGHSATLTELMIPLNKAYSQNDTQQASCILSFILEKKDLSKEDQDKFGLMKCNLLFTHKNYEECAGKVSQMLKQPHSQLSAAILSLYGARCKAELDRVWDGYMDLERAKALLLDLRVQRQKRVAQQELKLEFLDTEFDGVLRDLNTMELEYNIRTNKEKHIVNLLHPLFPQFRNRKVLKVSCGDHHAIILVSDSYSENQREAQSQGNQKTEVFGIGENSAGQVLGTIYDKSPCDVEPVIIKELSGKGIVGVCAFRESSMAYDPQGNIYEWGVKANGNKGVQKTVQLGTSIKKLDMGNKHCAALTNSGKLFVWGTIQHKGTAIFAEQKPFQIKGPVMVQVSCGANHVVTVEKEGQVYGMGSNQSSQLGIAQSYAKTLVVLDTRRVGKVQRVFGLNECTFVLTQDQELFFCGKHSYKKQPVSTWKQCEFTDQIASIISVSGYTGVFYVTNQNGVVYKWDVDNSVKFRRSGQKQFTPRVVSCSRGIQYRLKTLPEPLCCLGRVITKSMKTYTPIHLEITLKDSLGIYGLDLAQPLKIHLCISKGTLKLDQLVDSSEKFSKLTSSKYSKNQIYLDQIQENTLLSYAVITSNTPSKVMIEVLIDKAGIYNLYVLANSIQIQGSPFGVEVGQSDKEAQLEKKMLDQKNRKKEQKELQIQRLEEANKLEEEERLKELEKRKETQKRAEDTLKRHLKDQQEEKSRTEQERRRKADLQTGGGFDLTKIKPKNTNSQADQYKGNVPQLPDINLRPSSKRKLLLKKPSEPSVLSGMPSLAGQPGPAKSTILKRADSKPKKPT